MGNAEIRKGHPPTGISDKLSVRSDGLPRRTGWGTLLLPVTRHRGPERCAALEQAIGLARPRCGSL
jgi:hypothetical protein